MAENDCMKKLTSLSILCYVCVDCSSWKVLIHKMNAGRQSDLREKA
jgi:hypothetical protein